MPYDPDDLYTAEPKLLSIDCFPAFFTQPVPPPDYDISDNTGYSRISNDMSRVSMESSNAELDAGLLLLDPMSSRDDNDDDDDALPKKAYKLSCHPTLIFRLFAVCFFIPALVVLILAHRSRNIAAIIFVAISLTRNLLVLLHHALSSTLRIKFSIEFRGPLVQKPTRRCPEWLKQGILHGLVDLILFTITLITTIVANTRLYSWRYHYNLDFVISGCVVSYIGCAFYLLSCIDLGKPSSVTTSGSFSFNHEKKKGVDGLGSSPQVYRDIEAAGGLNAETRKTGADSPVII